MVDSVTRPAKDAAERLSAAEVADYLKRHPDFLVEHADLIALLTPPSRRQGDNVVDMQHFMLDRLRADLQRVTEFTEQASALFGADRVLTPKLVLPPPRLPEEARS